MTNPFEVVSGRLCLRVKSYGGVDVLVPVAHIKEAGFVMSEAAGLQALDAYCERTSGQPEEEQRGR